VFLLHFAAELLLHVPTQPLQWDPSSTLQRWWRGVATMIPFCAGVSTEVYPTSILSNIGQYERRAPRNGSGSGIGRESLIGSGSGSECIHGVLRDSNKTALCTFECMPTCTDEKNCDGRDAGGFLNSAVRNFISQSTAPLGVIVVPHLPDTMNFEEHSDVCVVKMVVDRDIGTVSVEAIGGDYHAGDVDLVPKSRIVCVFCCG